MKTMLAVLSAAAVLVAGCGHYLPLEPYRYRLADPSVICPDSEGKRAACTNTSSEASRRYDLHYVEFDDQGLQYPDDYERVVAKFAPGELAAPPDCDQKRNDCLFKRAWAYQINNLIKQLNVSAEAGPITLIVFVHGWKHNAKDDDPNLENFRKLLDTAALIEEQRRASSPGERPRRVVGVYVGWRGLSVDVPGLKELTFWSRKTAAMHVAQGSSRELFARLRSFKCVQNAKSASDGTRNCNRPPEKADKVRIILIGHSFGGLILYNSISGTLIESMTHAFDANGEAHSPYWRFADLAVLINPAFESTRYTPLHRIAASSRYERYETPLLVTVTSTTDRATRVAFKWGRAFNSLFEQHVDDEEKDANRETVGHHTPYVTHRLEVAEPSEPGLCAGWKVTPANASLEEAKRDLDTDLPIEYENSKHFFRTRGERFGSDDFRLTDDNRPLVRDFCGGVRLTSVAGDRNVPIWNVSAIGNEALLPDHNDIMQPLFVAFFRQLYMDTIYLKDMTDDIRQGR